MGHRYLLSLIGAALLFLTGCGDDTGTGGAGGSAGGNGGAGGQSGGAGGQGGGEETFEFGEPIDAPNNEWTWVGVPDSRCMNDTPSGFGINKSSASKNVAIFLAGGNACFNEASCSVTANRDGYAASAFAAEGGLTHPIFDRTTSPLKDWSFVFVPYCSGDIHGGRNSGVKIGNRTYTFRGHENMKNYLERIVPTFPDATQIVLMGESAGGFGAAYNVDFVSRAFEGKDLVLIDDSGPPMSKEFVAPCLQKRFAETWGLATTLPPTCPECLAADGTFTEAFFTHIVNKYPNHRFGLISSAEDEQIRQFWSFGLNDCAAIDVLPVPYEGTMYTDGLEDIRDRMLAGKSNFGMFFIGGEDEHVFLDNDLSTVMAGTTSLSTWLTQLVEGDSAWKSVP